MPHPLSRVGGQRRVLVADDEKGIVFAIRNFLESHDFSVVTADSFAGTVEAIRETSVDAAVLDHHLLDADVVNQLHVLRTIDPTVPLVILTGYGSIDLAVRAIKEGAEQFLTKPVDLPVLLVTLQRAIENRRNRQKDLAARGTAPPPIDPFVGTSAAIRRLADEARRLLETPSAILVLGETGTGKGVLARWLHANGPRQDEAFVDVNCAGLSREFLESELFGHERGAFTGAVAAKTGLLEVANRGTLFLDEIGDVDLAVQPKLLKVIEDRRFRKLGAVRERQVDVRLAAATHRDLAGMAKEGLFRADLYYRINAVPLRIAPLRERPEDIPAIAREILRREAGGRGRSCALSDAAVAALQAYRWPGNVRELRNVLERALLLSEDAVLDARDLRFDPGVPPPASGGATATLAELERRHIERVMLEEHGRVSAVAERLGVPRSTLYAKLKQYGLRSSRNGR